MPSKKSRIQLYADECFPVTVVTYLRSLGYSIIHAYDKNLVQKSDKFHLNTSKKLNRALITLDRDFNYYEQTALIDYPGVIIISVGSSTPPNITRVCMKLLKEISSDFVKGSLVKATISKLIKIKKEFVVSEKMFKEN